MLSLRAEYEKYMAAVEYRAEELPGDLYLMAKVAENAAPGYGVKIVMSWAENFRAQPVYWPMLDKALSKNKEVGLSEIKSNMIKMLAEDATKVCPDLGVYATLMVAMSFSQTTTFIHNLDQVKAPYRDKWIMARYYQGGVAAWELGLAVRLGLRQVEKVLATGGATVAKYTPQRSIFEFA